MSQPLIRPPAGATSNLNAALPAHLEDAVSVFLAEIGVVGTARLEDPQAQQPSMATRAKSLGLGDVRPAWSVASNWRWDRPSVGDSGGTFGRRGGDCASERVLGVGGEQHDGGGWCGVHG